MESSSKHQATVFSQLFAPCSTEARMKLCLCNPCCRGTKVNGKHVVAKAIELKGRPRQAMAAAKAVLV